MAKAMKLKSDGKTITVRVPISIRKRGGRKAILVPPDGGEHYPRALRCRQTDDAVIKALARAFRWREMIENGTYATIAEIAVAEKINESYVGRVLRLTLLAPDLIDAILGGLQPAEMTLRLLMKPFAIEWREQRTKFCVRTRDFP